MGLSEKKKKLLEALLADEKKKETETQLKSMTKSWPLAVGGRMTSLSTSAPEKEDGEEEDTMVPEPGLDTFGPARLLSGVAPEIREQDLGILKRSKRDGLEHVLQNKVCSVLHGVLSPAEADALASWVQKCGTWEPALLNIGGGRQRLDMESRQHLRAIVDDVDLTKRLEERLRGFLPTHGRGGTELRGLNERLRFLRYVKGNFFAPHMDGVYARTDGSGERSAFTVLLYLTDPGQAVGGATRFLSGSCPAGKDWEMCKATSCQHCLDAPITKGSVLLFSHDILHQGSPLLEGNKLVMRTDVMYSH